jgi:hypothetical protein
VFKGPNASLPHVKQSIGARQSRSRRRACCRNMSLASCSASELAFRAELLHGRFDRGSFGCFKICIAIDGGRWSFARSSRCEDRCGGPSRFRVCGRMRNDQARQPGLRVSERTNFGLQRSAGPLPGVGTLQTILEIFGISDGKLSQFI